MTYTPNGINTALVTPFTSADAFDEAAFRKLIEFQIGAGISGLLVIGGSGEFVSLTPAERQRVVEVAIDQTAKRIPILVGALAPGTREVQATVRHAAKAGADAVLVLPTYYIKASADGVCEHFARVADTASIPIVAYNNTGRTGITLDVGILERLARIPSIVALKECERDLAVVSAKIKAVGDRIAILSGDDDLGFPSLPAWQPRRDLHERQPDPGLPPPAFRGFGEWTDRLGAQRALRAPAADRSPLHREPPRPFEGCHGVRRPSRRASPCSAAKGQRRSTPAGRARVTTADRS